MKINLIKSLDNTFKIAFPEGYDTAKKIKVNVPYEFEFSYICIKVTAYQFK